MGGGMGEERGDCAVLLIITSWNVVVTFYVQALHLSYFTSSLPQPFQVAAFVIPNLPMRRLSFREVKSRQSHTAVWWQSQNSNSELTPEPNLPAAYGWQ